MHRTLSPILLLLFACLVLPGCSDKSTAPAENRAPANAKVINGVPFVKQKDRFCGPAAMASVLEFYGDGISQEEIAVEVYSAKLDGALISDMENFARDRGYRAEVISGDMNTLEEEIDAGVPVILLVDKGKWMVSVPHYYVVYGYDAENRVFIANTGDTEGEAIPFERLDSEWEKMNRLMLIVLK